MNNIYYLLLSFLVLWAIVINKYWKIMSYLAKMKNAKFNIGDIVIHKNQRYRAVIIDIDPVFQASRVYNPLVNRYRFATDNLWYRLLVNNSSQETYVRESLLKIDISNPIIYNPDIKNYLYFSNGTYKKISVNH